MSLFKRFIQFQYERFPLKILLFTTAATVMSSTAILGYSADWYKVVMAFLATMFFLYHIRVIDESRDMDQDAQIYPNRPVQRGLISLRELFYIDLAGILIISAFSIVSGKYATLFAATVFAFTTLAWKDFFLKDFFKDKPVLYHLINSPQMALILIYIYTLLTDSFTISPVMWMNMAFVYINIFIIEMIRKIKISSEETKGTDTYSVTMGYKKSLLFTLCLLLFSEAAYIGIIFLLGKPTGLFIIYSIPFIVLAGIALLTHLKKGRKSTEKFLLLSIILVYIALNSLICLFNL